MVEAAQQDPIEFGTPSALAAQRIEGYRASWDLSENCRCNSNIR